MNTVHTVIIYLLIGGIFAMPHVQRIHRERRDTGGVINEDKENGIQPFDIIGEIENLALTKDIQFVDEETNDDMDVAESHIFRPIFRYRGQIEERKRLRQGQRIIG